MSKAASVVEMIRICLWAATGCCLVVVPLWAANEFIGLEIVIKPTRPKIAAPKDETAGDR